MPNSAAVPSTPLTSTVRSRRRNRFAPPLTVVAVTIGWILVWWAAVALTGVSSDFLPSPFVVLKRAIVLIYQPVGAGALATHVLASLQRLLGGFALAVIVGIPLGVLMGSVRAINWFVAPIFELFRYVPPIAWAPFAMLWFGAGYEAQMYVIFTAAFPPILMNTYRGMQLIDRRLLAAARSLGANPFVIMREVALPSALPLIVAGLQIGLAAGWMALIAAEIVAGSGSRDGLGYLILQGQQQLQADLTLSAMFVIGLLGAIINFAVRHFETRFVTWRD